MKPFNWRFGLQFFAGFLVCILALRLILQVTEPLLVVNQGWSKSRARGILETIPKLVRDKNLILFLGASEAESGFDPLIFDREMEKRNLHAQSYNMALRNVGTYLPLYLERIRSELAAAQVRPAITFLHIPHSRLNKWTLGSLDEGARLHDVTSVFFDLDLWSCLPNSTEEKLWLTFNKYLLGEHSLLQLHLSLGALFRRPWQQASLPVKFWYGPKLNPLPGFAMERRGQFYFNWQNNPEFFDWALGRGSQRIYQQTLEKEVLCCNIRNVDIDQEYLEHTLTAVKRLAAMTDHLVLVDLPEHPALERDPQAIAGLADYHRALAVEASWKFWKPEMSFAPDEYLEVLHFSPKGVEKFARWLSESVPAEWVQKTAAD